MKMLSTIAFTIVTLLTLNLMADSIYGLNPYDEKVFVGRKIKGMGTSRAFKSGGAAGSGGAGIGAASAGILYLPDDYVKVMGTSYAFKSGGAAGSGGEGIGAASAGILYLEDYVPPFHSH